MMNKGGGKGRDEGNFDKRENMYFLLFCLIEKEVECVCDYLMAQL